MKPILSHSFPHIRRGLTSRDVMTDVLIASVPPLFGAVWNFGWRAIATVLTAAVSGWAADRIGCRLRRQEGSDDRSGLVTGVLLALSLPVGVPFWALIAASLFSVLIVKQLFGGIGRNIFNPAMAGRAMLLLAFPQVVSGYTRLDALSSSTPLASLDTSPWTMLFGRENGSAGETSVVLILLGGLYLLVRRRISWKGPLSCLAAFAGFIWIFGGASPFTGPVIPHLLSGGIVFGAFFFITDYTTRPATPLGECLYAGGVGILTAVLRLWGRYPEGVCFAILLMNAAAPLLEYLTRRRVYGTSIRKGTHT